MDDAENRAIRPLLRLFRLRSATFANELVARQQFKFRLERDISVGVEELSNDDGDAAAKAANKDKNEKVRKPRKGKKNAPSTTDIQLRGVVDIALKAAFLDENEMALEGIAAAATYKAIFQFPDSVKVADIEQAMNSEAYQYQFVAQAVPLALRHFKEELALMGLSSTGVLLGVA